MIVGIVHDTWYTDLRKLPGPGPLDPRIHTLAVGHARGCTYLGEPDPLPSYTLSVQTEQDARRQQQDLYALIDRRLMPVRYLASDGLQGYSQGALPVRYK